MISREALRAALRSPMRRIEISTVDEMRRYFDAPSGGIDQAVAYFSDYSPPAAVPNPEERLCSDFVDPGMA